MKFKSWFIVWGVTAIGAQLGNARELTLDEKLSDFHQLVAQIQAGYGPLQYKATTQGIELKEVSDRFEKLVVQTKTNSEFYYLLVQMIASFKDSHFRAWVDTDREASIPFSTDLIDGKVLIDSIDRDALPVKTFPFERGDEVIEMDGKPVATVMASIRENLAAGYELTRLRRAAMALTFRPAQSLPLPEVKQSVFKVRHGTSSVIDSVTLDWKFSGEWLGDTLIASQVSSMDAFEGTLNARDFDDLSLGEPEAERSFRCSGKTRIQIPADATMVMEEPFVAYYHPTAKGNIGYLRIPHYSWEKESELRFQNYVYAVSVLEKNTVGLIIDQDHNCGGSVQFLHNMVSLFSTAAFRPTQFQLLANREEVLGYKAWVNSAPKGTLERVQASKVFDLLSAAWIKGDFMTAMTSIAGDDLVYPHSIHYTKPIVVLIDEMSGSGGDAFPALMQGIGRAKLLGTRTMGAGGHVVEQSPLYFSRMLSRMTKSLFYRPDGVAIENNGAVPDYPYSITRDDFVYGYRGYQQFYLNALLAQVP